MFLELPSFLAQRLDWRVELGHVGHDYDQIADADRAGLHVARAHEEDGRGPDRGRHADEQRPLAGLSHVFDPSPHAVSKVAVEYACPQIPPPPGTNHPR